MQKSKIATLDQITDEETESSERKVTPGAKPKMSYKTAMGSYFIDLAGEICQVRTCSAATFHSFAQACIRLTKRPDLCKMDLAGLCYDELISRWFALETLQTRGAKLPLFTSEQEAVQSLNSQRLSKVV